MSTPLIDRTIKRVLNKVINEENFYGFYLKLQVKHKVDDFSSKASKKKQNETKQKL